MSIPPGGGVRPGALPGRVLPTSRASAPRSARGHLARDRARRVVTAAHRSGRVGPGWPPWRTGGGGSGRGCAVSCGEPRAGGGRAHPDSAGDPEFRTGSGDVILR